MHLVATGKDEAVFAAAERVAHELAAQGIDVLYDDRPGKVSPGVKFKDAELIGVPTIVVVGKGLADGTVEVKDRRHRRARGRPGRPGRRPPRAPGPRLSVAGFLAAPRAQRRGGGRADAMAEVRFVDAAQRSRPRDACTPSDEPTGR